MLQNITDFLLDNNVYIIVLDTFKYYKNIIAEKVFQYLQ